MTKIKIAVLVGSNRRESINRKLAQAIAMLGGNNWPSISSRSTICPSAL
jgi:chromate reductase